MSLLSVHIVGVVFLRSLHSVSWWKQTDVPLASMGHPDPGLSTATSGASPNTRSWALSALPLPPSLEIRDPNSAE